MSAQRRWAIVAVSISALHACFLLVFTPAWLVGQTDSVHLAFAFRDVPLDTHLRIRLKAGRLLLGTYHGTNKESILLHDRWVGTGRRDVPVADITTVWAHRGTQVGKGVLLGAGIGVGTGLLIALAVGEAGDLRQRELRLPPGALLVSLEWSRDSSQGA